MTTDHLRRLVCPTASAEPVDDVTAPGGRTPGNLAATSDAQDPGGINSPDAARDRRITADDVLDRIKDLRATDDTFHRKGFKP